MLPMFLFWIGMHGTGMGEDVPLPLALIYECMAYAVGWLLFPLIAYYLCVHVERADQYVRYIVAYNWSSVIQNGLFFLLNVPTALGLMGPNARSFFGLILLLYILTYGWFVAKSALGLTPQRAAIFVAADFITSMLWERVTDWLVSGG
ncbi:MAG: hypothetical protein O2944_07965 [Proteobacteria bacterium]|nr:hypothetical protein [Pseudomonadota bacterium]